MGLFDFLNKPSPQVMRDALNEAVKKSQEYARNGDRENALKVLVEHKDWGWNAPNYLVFLGDAYFNADYAAEAMECYKRSIELKADNAIAHTNLGRIYFKERDYAKAAQAFRQGVYLMEAAPGKYNKLDCFVAFEGYGLCLAGIGQKAEGEKYIKKAKSFGYRVNDSLKQMVGLSVADAGKWNAFKEALFSKMPFLRETLRAGVSEDSIKAAEAEIGAAFPSELKGLYLTNDGDNNEALCGMMLGFRFLSLQAMLTEWRSMKAIAEYAGKRWLPFGSDNGGNFIAVSLDPDNSGKTGQVINFGRDERVVTVIADSLGALFERFTRIVNSRDFYIGEYDGEDVILLGTDDVDEGSYLTDYLKSENSVK